MSTYRLKGASGAVINQSFPLGARTVIGRADDCDLRLDQDGVAAHHAEISQAADGLVL
jgi:pSer/pThr/pTyr-binding forkhead associated (FHA) protein